MSRRIALWIAVPPTALAAAAGLVWIGLQPPALPVPPRGAFTVKDVTIVNPGLGRTLHADLRIEAGTIRSIGPTTPGRAEGDVRCDGCFALPGLLDMHAHLPPRAAIGNERLFALLFLANGVTTIREMGSADGAAYAIRDEIARGDYPGPRVVSCGRVLDGDPPTRPNNVVLRTPEEGRAAVAEAVRHGARCIKLYNMLSRDVVLAIADAAREAGLPIVAHVPHSVSLTEAGYIADVAHFTGVPIPADPEARGRDDYVNADFANVSDARIDEVVAAALRLGTIHTPAIVNEESRRTLAGADRYPPDPQIAVLPAFWPAIWHSIWIPPNRGAKERSYEGFLDRERALVRALFRAGAPVYAGTDTLMPFVAPGAALTREVRNLAELGFGPEQALAAATTSPGRFWKDRRFGAIEVGLPADIVLYRDDPTVSLAALDALDTVIADGRVYPGARLDEWVERYRSHFHGWLYDTVMNAVAARLAGRYDPPEHYDP
jgi:cytosine/adenosine deaminase-related metal-dependent hydrolase